MSKVITGGTSSGGGYTDTYSTLTATTFTNTYAMTSPNATITNLNTTSASASSASITYSLVVPTLNSTTGNITTLNASRATITNGVSAGSAVFTDLSSSAISATNLTATNCTITGTLTMSGSIDQSSLSTQTLTVGTQTVSFPTGVSEFDSTSIVYDIDNKFSEFIDKRTGFGTVQNGPDLSISVDDPDTPAVETSYGINGVAAIEFGGGMTSYIDADTSNTASSTDMTVVIVFRKADECDNIISYENAQPSFNCTGGVLYLERNGKYNINTGITISNLTSYILVATLSTTAGLQIRINGVQQFSDATSYGTYHFNTALCNFGRHYNDTEKWFVGRIGDVMTAPKILSTTEIDNIETYLSTKFQIAIGSSPTIRTGDPFSTGSGSCTVYGTIDSVGIVSDTLEVSGATTLNNLTLDGSLIVGVNATTNELTASVLTTNGVYYENISSVIVNSTNVYLLSYTNSGIFYIGGANNPTANFSVSIEQIPTDTTKVYTISLVYYQSSHAYYCNAVRASDKDGTYLLGTASTYVAPKFSGGTPSFTTTPNLVIQQFTIVSFPDDQSTMTRYVISSVAPFS